MNHRCSLACFSCCLLFPPLLPAQLTLNCSPGSPSSRRECVVFIKERKCANEHRGPKISGVLILFPLVALFTSGVQLIAYTDSKFVCEAPRLRETGWRDTHTPLPVCVTCWGLSSYTVCADECRSGHTLCGPVPMGTAVIANSLFLWFLAVLPLLEYWQALGRSDMQNLCQVGFMWKECFLFDFLLCVSKATLSYSVTRLRWNSTFFLVFFLPPIVDQTALVFQSSLHATSWQTELVLEGSQSPPPSRWMRDQF